MCLIIVVSSRVREVPLIRVARLPTCGRSDRGGGVFGLLPAGLFGTDVLTGVMEWRVVGSMVLDSHSTEGGVVVWQFVRS